jgi:voltage-dependent calcium channel T type alpha-1G
MKIVALGFCSGHRAYLKSSWNVIDFLIVIASVVEFALEELRLPGVNLRPLRTLRILRPLKAMKTVPSLRKQASALISSSKGFVNVAAFLAFIYLMFAIFGL